jgi:hypothetical protein
MDRARPVRAAALDGLQQPGPAERLVGDDEHGVHRSRPFGRVSVARGHQHGVSGPSRYAPPGLAQLGVELAPLLVGTPPAL